MSGYVLNTVPQRYDFPSMLIPVFSKIKNPSFLSKDLINKEELLKKNGLESVNVLWRDDVLYCGPTTVLSEHIRYNKIVGFDKTLLYACTDAYDGFYEPHEGWPTTSCFIDSYESIPVEKNNLFNDIFNYYKLDNVFEVGNSIVKKYPIRKGSFINAYGYHNLEGPCYIGVLMLVPRKRDLEPVYIKFFNGDSEEHVRTLITETKIATDPQEKRFSQVYASIFKIEEETVSIGFLCAACHLVHFGYDASIGKDREHMIIGVSKHEELLEDEKRDKS